MSAETDFRPFWGKAQPVAGSGCDWHPLWMHSLDVAAVGRILAACHPAPFRAMADALGWAADDLVRLWTLALALHDLGKFARVFQAKSPERWPAAVLGPLDEATLRQADPGHPATGIGLLRRALRPLLDPALPGWRLPQFTTFFLPVLAHHGRPVDADDLPQLTFGPAAEAAALAFARAMLGLLAPPPVPAPDAAVLRRVGWRLAGLSVAADWIGSNQGWFPYAADSGEPVAAYWTGTALPRAETAVRAAGILPAPAAPYAGLAALTGRPGLVPSPLQAWAEQVDLPAGPLLFMLEDMTGSGKTEAALAIVHRLMAAGRANGLYLALPTMATANAMYRRLGTAYRRMFEAAARPSLVLAHGRAALDDGFRQSILEPVPGQRAADDRDAPDGDCAAECAAWLAHDRRKAFFADIGVGTIDQALLAVLPAKHQAIRLAALADRVLVVDEAHAYDAYMSAEIDRLLAAHAMQGGHAIVLSATLPRPTKQRIALEWSAAARAPAAPRLGSAYPGATRLAVGAPVLEQPIAPRRDLPRRLVAERLADPEAAVAAIASAARAGAAIAWVRNTVDDAIAATDLLAARGIAADLFHARFAMGHRLAIENAVLARFGRDGTPEHRRGRVLVATQVVEQSLDLDFDLMVSDLAPIDLLLQRAGRVWRHLDRRPAAGGGGGGAPPPPGGAGPPPPPPPAGRGGGPPPPPAPGRGAAGARTAPPRPGARPGRHRRARLGEVVPARYRGRLPGSRHPLVERAAGLPDERHPGPGRRARADRARLRRGGRCGGAGRPGAQPSGGAGRAFGRALLCAAQPARSRRRLCPGRPALAGRDPGGDPPRRRPPHAPPRPLGRGDAGAALPRPRSEAGLGHVGSVSARGPHRKRGPGDRTARRRDRRSEGDLGPLRAGRAAGGAGRGCRRPARRSRRRQGPAGRAALPGRARPGGPPTARSRRWAVIARARPACPERGSCCII